MPKWKSHTYSFQCPINEVLIRKNGLLDSKVAIFCEDFIYWTSKTIGVDMWSQVPFTTHCILC